MKRCAKNIAIACIFAFLLPAASLSSWASDDSSDASCIKCGQGTMVITSVANGPWEIVGSAPCTHTDDPAIRYDPWVLDELHQRTVTTTYTCDRCGYQEKLPTEETKVVHHIEEDEKK